MHVVALMVPIWVPQATTCLATGPQTLTVVEIQYLLISGTLGLVQQNHDGPQSVVYFWANVEIQHTELREHELQEGAIQYQLQSLFYLELGSSATETRFLCQPFLKTISPLEYKHPTNR